MLKLAYFLRNLQTARAMPWKSANYYKIRVFSCEDSFKNLRLNELQRNHFDWHFSTHDQHRVLKR